MAEQGLFSLFYYCIIVTVFQLKGHVALVDVQETDPKGTVLANETDFNSCTVTSLDPPQTDTYVNVTNQNVLVITKPLDLEVLQLKDNSATLTVSYKCDSTSKRLTINIIPVNEFNPVFVGSPFYVKVQEEIVVGTQIIFFGDKWEDEDKIKYGVASMFDLHLFAITAFDGRGHFTIDKMTGNITTSTELDYENLPGRNYFMLNISVQDDGGRITFSTVNITIEDVDDNPPVFRLPSCQDKSEQCHVTEYTAITNRFFQGVLSISPSRIYARDRDRGINADIMYTIESDDEMSMNIQIDNITGEVQIVVPYANFTNWTDTDVLKNISLNVKATEDSINSRTTNITLTILVHRDLPTTTSLPMTSHSTSSTPTTPTTSKSESEFRIDPILLVEIIVPIAVVIIIVIIVICLIRSRKRRQRDTRYKLRESQRLEKIRKSKNFEHENIDVISSTPINPYELINMYARMDTDKNSKEGSSKSSKTEDDVPTGKESGSIDNDESYINVDSETNGKSGNLYTKVRKPKTRQKQALPNLNDAFDSNIHADTEDDFTASERNSCRSDGYNIGEPLGIHDIENENGHNYVNTEDAEECCTTADTDYKSGDYSRYSAVDEF